MSYKSDTQRKAVWAHRRKRMGKTVKRSEAMSMPFMMQSADVVAFATQLGKMAAETPLGVPAPPSMATEALNNTARDNPGANAQLPLPVQQGAAVAPANAKDMLMQQMLKSQQTPGMKLGCSKMPKPKNMPKKRVTKR